MPLDEKPLRRSGIKISLVKIVFLHRLFDGPLLGCFKPNYESEVSCISFTMEISVTYPPDINDTVFSRM